MSGFDQTLRHPNANSSGFVGSFFSEKCQRDIHYESKNEYLTYKILENSSKVKWYREQPIRIPYKHLGKLRNYYPDVIVLTDEGRGVIVEVKSPNGVYTGMVHWEVLAKSIAAKNFLHKLGIGYLMVDYRGRSLQTLSKGAFNSEIAAKILDDIQLNGEVNFRRYKTIIGESRFSDQELCNLIVQNDLAFHPKPFSLKKLPQTMSFDSLI